MAKKQSTCCKVCGLLFNEDNLHLFSIEKHLTKQGIKTHYRSSRCKKCSNKLGVNYINKNREYIKSLKEETPCKDCGKNYPYYVMHFDHLRDKKFNIGSSTNLKKVTLLDEISKCEIVCANCHAERTHKRIYDSK
jgi:hypothetical protein